MFRRSAGTIGAARRGDNPLDYPDELLLPNHPDASSPIFFQPRDCRTPMKTLPLLALSLALTSLGLPAARAGNYNIIDLGDPVNNPLGNWGTQATGVNDSGQVVGLILHPIINNNPDSTSYNSFHSFLYSGGVMTDISPVATNDNSAAAINNAGQVAGSADFGRFRGYANVDFINGTWSTETETGVGGSFAVVSQTTSGGNPGNYLGIQNTSNNEGISALVFFSGSTFNPSTQGAVTSINLSLDAIRFGGNGQGFSPAVRQGGVNYLVVPENTTYPASWSNGAWTNLTASSFQAVWTNSSNPDFSLTGGPIEFGFSNTNSALGFRVTSSGYDNFSVTVNYTPIPEPSTYAALAGVGALGLGLWRWQNERRRRRVQ